MFADLLKKKKFHQIQVTSYIPQSESKKEQMRSWKVNHEEGPPASTASALNINGSHPQHSSGHSGSTINKGKKSKDQKGNHNKPTLISQKS
jgi:hypothetical protein